MNNGSFLPNGVEQTRGEGATEATAATAGKRKQTKNATGVLAKSMKDNTPAQESAFSQNERSA